MEFQARPPHFYLKLDGLLAQPGFDGSYEKHRPLLKQDYYQLSVWYIVIFFKLVVIFTKIITFDSIAQLDKFHPNFWSNKLLGRKHCLFPLSLNIILAWLLNVSRDSNLQSILHITKP